MGDDEDFELSENELFFDLIASLQGQARREKNPVLRAQIEREISRLKSELHKSIGEFGRKKAVRKPVSRRKPAQKANVKAHKRPVTIGTCGKCRR